MYIFGAWATFLYQAEEERNIKAMDGSMQDERVAPLGVCINMH
jgi:hypothetical protein